MSAGERYELPPERLGRWLERWAAANGPVARARIEEAAVTFTGEAGATVRCEPPFPPLGAAAGTVEGFAFDALREHVALERRVGVLLVRLGAHAAGVFAGRELVASKVDRRLVHGRHRKGGSSSKRFARRRDEQARASLDAAAQVAERVLVPEARAGRLEAVVTGGDRRAVSAVLADGRLAPLVPLVVARVLDVPEPRLDVLRATPARFLATVVIPGAPD